MSSIRLRRSTRYCWRSCAIVSRRSPTRWPWSPIAPRTRCSSRRRRTTPRRWSRVGGEVFASPRRYGVLTMLAMPMDDTLKAIGDDFAEGDIFISNDPEATRGMATHLPDVYFWKPIFHRRGRLVCWAWSFIHSSDVGGKVPGSISPSSYEIHQEGIRVPPRKLVQPRRAGRGLPEGLPGQLPHSGPELGRHEGVRRRAEHRRAARRTRWSSSTATRRSSRASTPCSTTPRRRRGA